MFPNELQANPGLLLEYRTPSEGTVDGQLYHLWRLLNRLGENSSHYAIADISPLRLLFADAAADFLCKAMIEYWPLLHTALISEVPQEERWTSHAGDLLGIVGVTLEHLSMLTDSLRISNVVDF